ncbi:MAG: hypothetical protein RML95_14860, partial [Anaerolineae bacterium]|nr:hypothetical protein [Anaerolineae bacterium]
MFEVTLTLANSAPLDLTPYLKQLYIRLGIHTPIAGTATAGTCYLRLDNSDRRFTPNNASSPYYGLLLPSRRVQVKIDGVTVFVGRLRRITLSSGMYAEREAYFECEDLLSTLQATNISLPLQEKRRADQLIRVILARAFRTATAEGFLRYKMNNPPAVAENDTVTINDVTYRFRATPVQANDVRRESGANRAEQIENLLAAINGGQGEGTRYFTGTKQPTG